MNDIKELEPKEKVALGACLLIFMSAALVVGMLFCGPEKSKKEQACQDIHEALDGALESISNRLFLIR